MSKKGQQIPRLVPLRYGTVQCEACRETHGGHACRLVACLRSKRPRPQGCPLRRLPPWSSAPWP